jgi:hypothetical protein
MIIQGKYNFSEMNTLYNNSNDENIVNHNKNPESVSSNTAVEKTSNIVTHQDRIDKLSELVGEKALKRAGLIECETCKTRMYQDDSDDGGVSFQAPGHISPSQSLAKVMSHEAEHVIREPIHAERDGKMVVGQSVVLKYAICPECGRQYVAGGVTHTQTVDDPTNSKKDSTFLYNVNEQSEKGILVNLQG